MQKLSVQEKAEKIYMHMMDTMKHPWSNSDPFKLSDANVKPLEDDQTNKNERDKGRLPLPASAPFPFSVIHKNIVKIKAKPEFRAEHLSTYVFHQDQEANPESLKVLQIDLEGDMCPRYEINITEDRARIFLQSLINLSRICTFNFDEYWDKLQIIRATRFFLLGEPGTGKTTFINYLLSVFAEDLLIPQKTMMIRIDLSRAIDKRTDFQKLILTKFYKIYHDLAFRRKIWTIDFEKLKEFIVDKRNITSSEEKELKCIERSISNFRKRVTRIEYAFLDDLMQFLTAYKEISYIFVFDGLDYVTLEEIHTAQFQAWLKQIDRYILSPEAYKGAYVLTMRDISFHKALESKVGGTDEFWRNPKQVTVKRCPLEIMIAKKLDKTRTEIIRQVHKWRDSGSPEFHEFAWITPDVAAMIVDEYVAYVSLPFLQGRASLDAVKNYADLKRLVNSEGLKRLEGISCGNYRCLMRNLNLVIGHFAYSYGQKPEKAFAQLTFQQRLKALQAREYYVLRAFIVGRIEFEDYRTPYSYTFKRKTGTEVKFQKKGMRFVIPPITNFVHIARQTARLNQFRGLFKLRFLQYLRSAKEPVSVSFIVWYLSDNFGYSTEFVLYDIDEMLYSQLIKVGNPYEFHRRQDCTIEITELGRFILENMIYWFIYYEVMLDSLPMPQSVADCIQPLSFYWLKAKNISNYVLCKTRDVMLYLNYLAYVEEKEKALFNILQSKRAAEERERFEDHFEPLMKGIVKSVKEKIISNFCSRLTENEEEFLSLCCRKLNMKWSN